MCCQVKTWGATFLLMSANPGAALDALSTVLPGAKGPKYSVCLVCAKKSSEFKRTGGISCMMQISQSECGACDKWICDGDDVTCNVVLEDEWQTLYKDQNQCHGPLRCKWCADKLVPVDAEDAPVKEVALDEAVVEEEVKEDVEEEDEDDDLALASLECDAVPNDSKRAKAADNAATATANAEAEKAAEAERRAERQRKKDLSIMLGFNNNLRPTDAAGVPCENTRQKLVCVSLSLRELKCCLVSFLWEALSEGSTHWTTESHTSLLTVVPIFAHYLSRAFAVLDNKYQNFEDLVEQEGDDWRSKCKLRTAAFWNKYFTMGDKTRDALHEKLRTHTGSIVYATSRAHSGRVVGSAHSHAQH